MKVSLHKNPSSSPQKKVSLPPRLFQFNRKCLMLANEKGKITIRERRQHSLSARLAKTIHHTIAIDIQPLLQTMAPSKATRIQRRLHREGISNFIFLIEILHGDRPRMCFFYENAIQCSACLLVCEFGCKTQTLWFNYSKNSH